MNSAQEPTEPLEHVVNGLPEPERLRKSGSLIAGFILLLAFGLRLYRLPLQSIWWDEGHSLFVAGHNLLDIPAIPAMDVHPPLYFWLLHIWMGPAGSSEFALRFLSLIFGVLTVALMYKVGRELFGTAGGWVAALLATFSPLYLAYSQEVRMYTLVGMFSLLSVYLFSRYMQTDTVKRPKRLLLYAVATAAGLYAHYFFGFLLIFENLYWLGAVFLSGRWRERREWTTWAAGQAVIVLLLAPQIYTATRQVTSYKNTNLIPPEFTEFLASCWRAFTLGVNGGRENPQGNAQLWMIVVAAILIAGLLARYIPRTDRKVKVHQLSLWALSLVLPLLVYYLVLLDRASFSPRYLIIVTPAFYILLSYSVWQLGRRWIPLGALALILLSVTFAVSGSTYFFDSSYAKDETRDLARFLEDRATADDVIFIDVPHPLDYYYQGEASQRYLFVDIHTIANVLTEESEGKNRLFFIRWRESDTDPRGAVRFLLDKYGQYRGQQHFRGYQVVWYDLPHPAHFSLPTELEPTRVNFENRMLLTGKANGGRGQGNTSTEEEIRRSVIPAGRSAWVTMEWRITEGVCGDDACLLDDYKVALYLEDSQGHRVGQTDKELLNDRHLRTTGWGADDVALNVYTLPVAPGTPPGEYNIVATVYRTEDGSPLSVFDVRGAPQGIAAPVGTLQVIRPAEPPSLPSLLIQTPVKAPLTEDILLLGYDLPRRTGQAGSVLSLSLYWGAQRDAQDDYQVRIGLFGPDGTSLAEASRRPVNGTYPTTDWVGGEVLRDRTDLLIPATVPAGEYELRVGLVPSGDSEPVGEVSLGGITVEGRAHHFDIPQIRHPLEANFGGKIKLLGYDLEGFEPTRWKIVLYWQALEEMDTNYKVFSHLLGSGDKMWGQKDDFPGAGTLPTTSWTKDEVLTDSYEIPVETNVPSGVYQLEFGFYDPVSGTRLPVIDESGNVLADRVLIPEIEIRQ